MNHFLPSAGAGARRFSDTRRSISIGALILYIVLSVVFVVFFACRRVDYGVLDDANYMASGFAAPAWWDAVTEEVSGNPVRVLFAEYGFYGFNYILYLLHLESFCVNIIIGASTTILCVAIWRLTRQPSLLLLSFTAFAPIIDNYVLHIRQGFALSIALLALSFKKPYVSLPILFLACTVHTGFLLLFMTVGLDVAARAFIRSSKRLNIVFVVGLIAAFLVSAVMFPIIEHFGLFQLRRDYGGAVARTKLVTNVGFGLFYVFGVAAFRYAYRNMNFRQALVGFGAFVGASFGTPFALRVFVTYMPLLFVSFFQLPPRSKPFVGVLWLFFAAVSLYFIVFAHWHPIIRFWESWENL
jgi:hypothetical protein